MEARWLVLRRREPERRITAMVSTLEDVWSKFEGKAPRSDSSEGSDLIYTVRASASETHPF
jgi:hypothetical protein